MILGVDDVWWLTADQMREVDRIAIGEFGVDLVRMMENAGRSLAKVAIDRFDPTSVVVLAGSGGNGGGGLVAARHLANRGVIVSVVRPRVDRMGPVVSAQSGIIDRLDVEIRTDPGDADLIIDALVGYSIEGSLRGRTAELVEWANVSPSPVLSLDVPSGLDATTGEGAPRIDADATLTLAMPKLGLRGATGVGALHLADISVPPQVYERMGLDPRPSPFRSAPIVEITRDG